MYYGVEQSTDLRDRRTVIKKFTTERSLNKWMEKSGEFTYADPESVRNYHHTFRYGYYLNGKIDKKNSIFKESGTSTYPLRETDKVANYLYKYGEEICHK